MYKKLILYIMFLNSLSLLGQELNDTLQHNSYKNAVFVEILGATGYLSVNYERIFDLLSNWAIKPGIGVGYADETFSSSTPQLISYIIKLDVSYKRNKIIKPVLGYAFAHNFEIGDPNSFRVGCGNNFTQTLNCDEKYTYMINSLSIGLGITFYKKFEIIPKYYALFEKRSDYTDVIFINWSGLQLKYKF